jgi:four helix bundle protein
MAFHAAEVALEIIRSVRGVLGAIRKEDGGLAEQARRAASSVALNVEEGNRREGRDRRHLWRIAAGSAAELRSALQQAEAWGYVAPAALEAPLALIDRELAMLWRLTHPAVA